MSIGFGLFRRETLFRSFPSFILWTALLGPSLAFAQEVDTRVWLEALDYLKGRRTTNEIDTLRNEALKHRPADIALVEAFLEALLTRKDRVQLHEYLYAVADANACRANAEPSEFPKQVQISQVCARLRSIWSERLSGLLFFETSVPKWEKARRALEAKDCRAAQAELRDIEVREGVFPDLISQKILAARCMGDPASAASLERELEKLRL
jgi:hypothetical protein